MPENPEKRINPRGPLIEFRITGESGEGEYFSAYARNISRGGLFILSESPREVGDRFHITFQIPDSDIVIRCHCEVAWARRYDPETKAEAGYGVRFLDLPEDIAMRITTWIFFHGS